MKWLKIWGKAKDKDRVVFPMEDKDKVAFSQDQVGKVSVVDKEVIVEAKEVKVVTFPHQTKAATHHNLPIKGHINNNNKLIHTREYLQ